MRFLNAVATCYYSFNQCLILQAEICYKNGNKYIDICGFEDLKQAPISQVAKILERAGYTIIINTHEPLKSELDINYRVNELDLNLENVQQYEDLLASLNYENKLINSCGVSYEKSYKKNSLFLLLQGSIELLKPTFLENFKGKKYCDYTHMMMTAITNSHDID